MKCKGMGATKYSMDRSILRYNEGACNGFYEKEHLAFHITAKTIDFIQMYNVRFSKGEFADISSGMRDMILEPNTFEKNSVRRTF